MGWRRSAQVYAAHNEFALSVLTLGGRRSNHRGSTGRRGGDARSVYGHLGCLYYTFKPNALPLTITRATVSIHADTLETLWLRHTLLAPDQAERRQLAHSGLPAGVAGVAVHIPAGIAADAALAGPAGSGPSARRAVVFVLDLAEGRRGRAVTHPLVLALVLGGAVEAGTRVLAHAAPINTRVVLRQLVAVVTRAAGKGFAEAALACQGVARAGTVALVERLAGGLAGAQVGGDAHAVQALAVPGDRAAQVARRAVGQRERCLALPSHTQRITGALRLGEGAVQCCAGVNTLARAFGAGVTQSLYVSIITWMAVINNYVQALVGYRHRFRVALPNLADPHGALHEGAWVVPATHTTHACLSNSRELPIIAGPAIRLNGVRAPPVLGVAHPLAVALIGGCGAHYVSAEVHPSAHAISAGVVLGRLLRIVAWCAVWCFDVHAQAGVDVAGAGGMALGESVSHVAWSQRLTPRHTRLPSGDETQESWVVCRSRSLQGDPTGAGTSTHSWLTGSQMLWATHGLSLLHFRGSHSGVPWHCPARQTSLGVAAS